MTGSKEQRLTVGCRASLKKSSSWTRSLFSFEVGRHVVLTERSGKEFAAIVLPPGFTGKLKKDPKLINNSVAWLSEEDLTFVNINLQENLDFIDWYQEVEEDICFGCGKYVLEYEQKCPECGYVNY